jgi:hypothetical protein
VCLYEYDYDCSIFIYLYDLSVLQSRFSLFFFTIRCPRAPLCRFWCRFGRKPGVTVGFRFFCSDLLSGVGLPPQKSGSQPYGGSQIRNRQIFCTKTRPEYAHFVRRRICAKFKCLMISRPRTQPPTAAAPTINQALSPEHKDILNVFNGLLATLDNLKLKQIPIYAITMSLIIPPLR